MGHFHLHSGAGNWRGKWAPDPMFYVYTGCGPVYWNLVYRAKIGFIPLTQLKNNRGADRGKMVGKKGIYGPFLLKFMNLFV